MKINMTKINNVLDKLNKASLCPIGTIIKITGFAALVVLCSIFGAFILWVVLMIIGIPIVFSGILARGCSNELSRMTHQYLGLSIGEFIFLAFIAMIIIAVLVDSAKKNRV
jgi:hypothetical protein